MKRLAFWHDHAGDRGPFGVLASSLGGETRVADTTIYAALIGRFTASGFNTETGEKWIALQN
jgi:hypothetical protein